MTKETTEAPKLPPAWFKHLFWRAHRLAYRLLGARCCGPRRASVAGVPCT